MTAPSERRQGEAVDRLVSPVMVGRSSELERLTSVMTDPPTVAVVEGEAGIGKTRLVSELGAKLTLTGCHFLVGGCPRIREPFPLGPVVEALRGAGEQLRADALSPVAGALRLLLPELAPMLPALPEPLDDRAAERHRVFRGLVEVLNSLGPTVVVLEDLHWADELTVEFVNYLLSELPSQLGLVLTFRGEDAATDIRALTAKLPETVGHTRVELGPLDVGQTGALAGAILDTDRVSDEFAAYVCERTSGLPYAIQELLALLQVRGTLVRRGGDWARRTLSEIEVPAGVRDAVLERVGRLSDEARSVAEAAALLQAPAPVAVLVTTCRQSRLQVLRGLEEMLDSGLLVEQAETVGYRHLLAAQAVYEDIPLPRRQLLHSRAASSLARLEPPPLGHLAHHLRHADRLHEWVDVAERAADQAIELGHDAEAARLLEAILRDGPMEPTRRGRAAVKLARAAMEAARGSDVLDLLVEVIDQDLPDPVRGELRFWMALLVGQTGGDLVSVRRPFAEAVDELGGRPDLRAWAMMILGLPNVAVGPFDEHRQWLDRALEVVPRVDDPGFRVFLLGKIAMGLSLMGDPGWRRLTARMREQAADSPHGRHEVNACCSVGVEACYAGHLTTADRLLVAAAEKVGSCESRRLELRVRSARALLSYCRGEWSGLTEEIDGLLDDLAEDRLVRDDVEVLSGCLALAHGDLDRAQRVLSDAAADAEARGGLDLLPIPLSASIRLAVARDEAEAVLEPVQRLIAAVEIRGAWPALARAVPALTLALIATDDLDAARRLVSRLTQDVRGLDAPLAAPALRYARGLLASAAHPTPQAARHLLAAAAEYDSLQCPYESAQASEHAAIALFAGEDTRAEATLRTAARVYRRLGATWDLARTGRIAAQHGVRLTTHSHRGGRRTYGDRLSPREREVAELAAQGRTNKQIGVELFLSVSTVKQHLAAAMRKFDVSSRAALAHRMTSEGHVIEQQK